MKKIQVRLKDGSICNGDQFDFTDYEKLKEIFADWQKINNKLKTLGGRNLNVPDVFSEALFCIFFNAVRTNGEAHSYDCEGTLPPPGIVRKDPRVPHTARRGTP